VLRHRHAGERGQTLIMSLVFLALFALFAATVLGFASVTEAQRGSNERTASIDGVAQGAAQFAVADTGILGCGVVSGGTLTFASGAILSYTVPSQGGCGVSSAGAPPGQDCELCLLGPGASPDADDTVLSTDTAVVVNGEIDGNGKVIGSGPVSSVGPNSRIALLNPACAQTCIPGPITLTKPFVDPLGALPSPPPEAASTTVNSWTSGDATTLRPGVYRTINASNGTVTLSSGPSGIGVYVITGSINVTDIGVLNTSGPVAIYLTCPTLVGSGSSRHWGCAAGQTGGTFNVSGTGSFALTTPASGTYAGISLFSDPNLSDPSDGHILNVGGSGGTFDGTIHIPKGSASVTGNGLGSAGLGVKGRMIVSALFIGGGATDILNISGTVTPSCSYHTDDVIGALNGGQPSLAGRVRFEANCNTGAADSIINFAFGSSP
jgi:hypothetical protein